VENDRMKRKILYITGTRADYGLMQSVLKAIEEHPKLELEIVATGMHLMPEFGMTINEIKKDGFKIHESR
jgi:UDP-N-acetylglucosamine 2-epimerase